MTGWLFAAFVALNILDSILTKIGIDGGAEERNPVAAWLMTHLGMIPGLVVLKLVMLAVIYVVVFRYNQTIVLYLGLGLMTFVCISNWMVIRN